MTIYGTNVKTVGLICLSCAFWVIIRNPHTHFYEKSPTAFFLQFKGRLLYFAYDIVFPINNPSIAAEGPENSVLHGVTSPRNSRLFPDDFFYNFCKLTIFGGTPAPAYSNYHLRLQYFGQFRTITSTEYLYYYAVGQVEVWHNCPFSSIKDNTRASFQVCLATSIP